MVFFKWQCVDHSFLSGKECEGRRILNRQAGEMMRENYKNVCSKEGSCTCIVLVRSGKMWFSGVSEKATLQHKNYAAIYGKFEGRVNVKTTEINKMF